MKNSVTGEKTRKDDLIIAPVKVNTKHSIQEYLGVPEDWPIVERIKFNIILLPNRDDIRKAKPHDPRACALHNAACRTFGVPNAAIGADIAYIPQRDARGRPFIARVAPTAQTAKAIREFDKTGRMPEGGFSFIPLSKSRHLKAQRDYRANYIAQGRHKSARGTSKRRTPERQIPRTFYEKE